ncbi:class I SAM-dependent methyltransferase [Allokutzneria sp. A3M-2-11 16]|uniref:class I SAM-dependent methyltransferase n=1 Tax=Allokutzneria sp. A3M-2-11 16 TaxID=2962043 RepID=UPI0020B81375|nr:methyltransferase domain-containing protein [Allokutzneria sp. A3M-2-11 16]MCP3802455.1 class I SAM-dependent methyltransferase [Allokutzneria sp. A3M-2-11 16]
MTAGKSSRRRSGKWVRRTIQAGLIAGLVLDTAQLRRRLAGLRTLPDRPEPGQDRFRVLEAEDVRVDRATLAAARAHAQAEGLSTLDLVPRDLPVAQALDLLRAVDPTTYRTDRQAPGRGALHATLADDGVLRAAGIPTDNGHPSAPELAEAIAQLKLHAPGGTDLIVAPRLTSAPDVVAKDPEVLASMHGENTMGALLPQIAWLSTLAASTLINPAWALAAIGAWSAQPMIVFYGSKNMRPADLLSYSATRAVKEPKRLFAAIATAQSRTVERVDPVEERRASYQAELSKGTERFFGERRTDCPWCSSTRLETRLRTRDLLQRKPGTFVLDRCQDCGHVFQNPRLSPAGLDFYYRDFYDGLGEKKLDSLFKARGVMYRPRAESMKRFAQPESWLDVGTGHGHFCNAAREVWPQTTFDGLDITDGIKLAEHRGWIDRGYRGSFVELAPSMAANYDVVSMFHYMEHSLDPKLELEAAHTALRSGGHLLIEVPDPEARWADLLGKWWMPWLQPQHLHFVSIGNLRRQLEKMGFTVVLEQRAEAHEPIDLLSAAWTRLSNLAASGEDLPWYPAKPEPARKAIRAATLAVGSPFLLAASLADGALRPFAARLGLTNAYRVIARKS